MKILRSIIFTILVPGFVAIVVPSWLLVRGQAPDFDAGWLRWLGLLPGAVGATILLASIFEFLFAGGGSPAIWFTRPLAWLIGREPDRLVGSGLYRFTRNPMYLGVQLVIGAEALWFGSYPLVGYVLFGLLSFNLIVRYLEEPHLRKKYGASYEEYCRRVPRWL